MSPPSTLTCCRSELLWELLTASSTAPVVSAVSHSEETAVDPLKASRLCSSMPPLVGNVATGVCCTTPAVFTSAPNAEPPTPVCASARVASSVNALASPSATPRLSQRGARHVIAAMVISPCFSLWSLMEASRPPSGELVILKVAAGQEASPVVYRVHPFRIALSLADEHPDVVTAHAGLAFVARMVDFEEHGHHFASVAPLRAGRPRESPAWLAGVFARYLDERVHVAVQHEAAEDGGAVLYPGDVAAATRRVTRGRSGLEPERGEVTGGGRALACGQLRSVHKRAGLIDAPAARHPKARGAHGPKLRPRCHRARRRRGVPAGHRHDSGRQQPRHQDEMFALHHVCPASSVTGPCRMDAAPRAAWMPHRAERQGQCHSTVPENAIDFSRVSCVRCALAATRAHRFSGHGCVVSAPRRRKRNGVERIRRRLVGHSRNGRRGEWRAVHASRASVFRSVAYLLGLRRSSAQSARPAHHLDVGIMCCYRVGAFL